MIKSEVYEVLETSDNKGLTVGSYSLPAGKQFLKEQWPYGEKALDAAIKNKRCKLVTNKAESKEVTKEQISKGGK